MLHYGKIVPLCVTPYWDPKQFLGMNILNTPAVTMDTHIER